MLATIALGAIAIVLVLTGGRYREQPTRSRLTPANVGSPIQVAISPVAVAFGAGAVCVVDAARQTLTKVNAHTRAGDGTVQAYDPRTVQPAGPAATVPGANGLAVSDAGVWVSSRRAGTVTRIDAHSRRTDRPIRVGRGPADIAVGAAAVWVANADGGSVSRIDARSGRADTLIAVGARQVLAVTMGEGGVWVARAAGPDADRTQLVHIDLDAGKVIGAHPSPFLAPLH